MSIKTFGFQSLQEFSIFQVIFDFTILKAKSENHFRRFLSSLVSCSEASGFFNSLHLCPFLQVRAVAEEGYPVDNVEVFCPRDRSVKDRLIISSARPEYYESFKVEESEDSETPIFDCSQLHLVKVKHNGMFRPIPRKRG
jgi:hypothetical protein